MSIVSILIALLAAMIVFWVAEMLSVPRNIATVLAIILFILVAVGRVTLGV